MAGVDEIPTDEASITRAMSLPAWIYRDPEYFAVECDEVLRPSWQVVCHLADVPNPGDFHTFDFIGEHIVVVRGTDGAVAADDNCQIKVIHTVRQETLKKSYRVARRSSI